MLNVLYWCLSAILCSALVGLVGGFIIGNFTSGMVAAHIVGLR